MNGDEGSRAVEEATGRKPRRASLYANAYALVANQVSSAALGFLYWLLAARLYPVEVVGASSAAISTLLLIAALAQFGLKAGMARFIPRAGTRVRTLILSSYLLVASAAAVGTAIAVWLTGRLGARSLLTVGRATPALVVLAAAAWALFYLQDGVLVGLRKAKWVLAENLTFNIAKIALLVLGAKLLADSGIFASWFLPAPVAVLLVTVAVAAHLHRARAEYAHPPRVSLGEVASSVTADHIGTMAAEASVRLLPVIVVTVMGTAANAYFYQAWLIANTLTLVASGMTSSFAAEAAAAPDRIAEHGRGILRHMAMLVVPAAAVLTLGAPLVLALFGSEYAAAGAPVLRWLAVAALPVMFNIWYVGYTLVTGRPRRALGVQVLGAVLLLGLTWPLLRVFGVTGVAIAWLAAQTVVAAYSALDAVPALLHAHAPGTGVSALRRADWRFLLDSPVLGRTALFADGALAVSVTSLASAEVLPPQQAHDCDTAVAGDPASLPDAFAALRPGGACYAEWHVRRPFAARALARRMRAAGFEDVRVYWPLPALERARLWPAVGSKLPGYAGALRATLADAASPSLARALATAVGAGVTISAVCAVGRKPGGAGDGAWLSDRLGRTIAADADLKGDPLLIMRTGGERDENRVNWLVFERGADHPWAIAKASRAREERVRREHDMLEALDARTDLALALRVPRTLLWTEACGTPVHVQTMLPGTPALSAAAAFGFDAFAQRATAALFALAGEPVRVPPAQWSPRLLEPALTELETLLAGTCRDGLVADLRTAFSGLGTLPLVVTHNDCSPWNLAVAGYSFGLFDWECGTEAGLPLVDLVYCLATTALWLDGSPDPREIRASYERLLDPADDDGAVFTREISRYAEALGLSAEQVSLLRLATWALHATNDVRNLTRAHAPLERSVCLPLLLAELDRLREPAPLRLPERVERRRLEEAVVVSPHLDDAALSCGGAIARVVAEGTPVLVLTVFTADAPAGVPLSPQARRNHMRWGSDEPFAMRRAEDEAAMGVLGAEWTHLGLPETIYRRDAEGRPLSTHVPLHADDVAATLPVLTARLERVLAAHPAAAVLCPTGFGRQADHALVRMAVERVCEPERIVYYDEYPYTTRTDPARPADLPAHAFTLPLSAEELARQAAAVACYRSQVRGLFPTPLERALEIVAARVPALGPVLLRQPSPTHAARRVAQRLAKDAALLGGERYRRTAEGPSPFEAGRLESA